MAHQIDRMREQLLQSERECLESGTPREFLVYVVRNSQTARERILLMSNGEAARHRRANTLGMFFYSTDDAFDELESVRSAQWQPEPPSTVYECLVIDGRDHSRLRRLLRSSMDENPGEFEEHVARMPDQ